MSNDPAPPCPECRGILAYRDSRKRILRREGGIRQWVVIRRFRCGQCGRLHNELPDCMVPYKHYHAEVISGVLDGVVSPEDLESEDYPCAETMRLWIQWLAINLERIEEYLRSIAYEISDYCQEVLFSKESLLGSLRKNNLRWLEICLRSVCNSGGRLVPFRRCEQHAPTFLCPVTGQSV